jgi:hypothetical protein
VRGLIKAWGFELIHKVCDEPTLLVMRVSDEVTCWSGSMLNGRIDDTVFPVITVSFILFPVLYQE